MLLNQTVIAFGPVEQTATRENLGRTYGGRMRFLEEAERELQEVALKLEVLQQQLTVSPAVNAAG